MGPICCPKCLYGIIFLHCTKIPKRTQVSKETLWINKHVAGWNLKKINSSYSRDTADVYVRDSDGRRCRWSTPPLKQPSNLVFNFLNNSWLLLTIIFNHTQCKHGHWFVKLSSQFTKRNFFCICFISCITCVGLKMTWKVATSCHNKHIKTQLCPPFSYITISLINTEGMSNLQKV